MTQIKVAQKELLESPHELAAINPNDYELSPQEVKAATLIIESNMTPSANKYRHITMVDIAKELGVDRSTLWRIRRKPEFQRYVKDASASFVASAVPMASARLYELANGTQTGTSSIKAIEMILQMGGLYNAKQTVEIQSDGKQAEVSVEQLDAIIAKYSAVGE